MKKMIAILAMSSLVACATNEPTLNQIQTPSPGYFLNSGPSSADGSVLSIQWLYMFKPTIPKESISQIAFSCKGIPATSISIKADSIKYNEKGVTIVTAPVIAVSEASTPWLYSSFSTNTTCQAVVSRFNQSDLIETVPVAFSGATKSSLLTNLKRAFEFNKK